MKTNYITYAEAAERIGVTRQQISDYAQRKYFKTRKRARSVIIDEESFNAFIESNFADVQALDNLREAVAAETAELKAKRKEVEAERRSLSARCWFFNDGKHCLEEVLIALNSALNESSDHNSATPELLKGLAKRECDILLDICHGYSAREIKGSYGLSATRIQQLATRAIRKLSSTACGIRDVVEDNQKLTLRCARQHTNILFLKHQVLDQQERIEKLERELGIADERKKPGYSMADERRRFAEGYEVTNFNLSVRTLNCLKSADIDTLADLVRYTKADLLKFRNFGKKSYYELEELVESYPGGYEFHFGMDLYSDK